MNIIKFVKTLFEDETKRELEECQKAYALAKYESIHAKEGKKIEYFWEGYGVNPDGTPTSVAIWGGKAKTLEEAKKYKMAKIYKQTTETKLIQDIKGEKNGK